MTNPELFDIVELQVNLPEANRVIGDRGTIVECYTDEDFEVEFVTKAGETLALCTLSRQQFVVVWQSATQQWLPVREDYSQIKDKLFEGETVDSLYDKIKAQEQP
ncbi:MAG: DUF4926 domain-containing protein [Kovacikia sp.]